MKQPKHISSVDAATAIFAFDDATSKMIDGTIENPRRYLREFRESGYGTETEKTPMNFLFFGFLLGLDYADFVSSEAEKDLDE